MLETLEQRENAMRDVLRKIESKTDFKEFSDNEKKLAKECYDAKLFEGVVLEQMVSGRIIAEYRHEPRLTLKGVQFIQAKKTKNYKPKNWPKNMPMKKLSEKKIANINFWRRFSRVSRRLSSRSLFSISMR